MSAVRRAVLTTQSLTVLVSVRRCKSFSLWIYVESERNFNMFCASIRGVAVFNLDYVHERLADQEYVKERFDTFRY